VKRHSNKSIIPKIIVILGTLSIVGTILLFLRPRPQSLVRMKRPKKPAKLFTQVINAAQPKLLELWEQGDRFFPKDGVRCDQEILHDKNVGRSYYQCNPHFWQCFWQGGTTERPALEIDLFGQTFHVVAKASFDSRYYGLFRRLEPGLQLQYGYQVELEVREIPGLSQPMILADSCRDTYLPQRIYGYSKVADKKDEGFIWDNFDRNIFLDKFYVSNRQVNEWRILTGEKDKIEVDRNKWPHPALLNLKDQIAYCSFYGKRLLEAKLFDAATMTPSELKNPLPDRVYRPSTSWQRDITKSYLGMARINADYQLTPLDCQLAQVQGCQERYFSNDSATWMGFHFGLGFYPESFHNFIEPDKNLKMSSKFLAPASTWHELGVLSKWDGKQNAKMPVAFRCYEEVIP
jgi:hypothetical protein